METVLLRRLYPIEKFSGFQHDLDSLKYDIEDL
jgi:hypothetical protein